MLKKIFCIISLCVVFLVYVSSCKSNIISDEYKAENDIIVYDKQMSSGFSYQEVNMNNKANIVALLDNSIIYSRYEDNNTLISYYIFDIINNITHKFGTIKNPYIYVTMTAKIDDKLYFYMNTTEENKDNEIMIYSSLYEIDTSKGTLKKIITEQLYQTLIYIDVKGRDLISFKGIVQDDIGYTYLDVINIDNKGEVVQYKLLSKECDRVNDSGNAIFNFAQYDGYIYTFDRNSKDGVFTYVIKKYNEEGQHIQDIELEDKIINLINGEHVSKLQVFGHYALIRNFSGRGILCDISADSAAAKIIGSEELDIALSPKEDTIKKYYLMFNRISRSLWLIDEENNLIHELDNAFFREYISINYIAVNQNNNMLISLQSDSGRSTTYLINYLDIPVLSTHSLESDVILYY